MAKRFGQRLFEFCTVGYTIYGVYTVHQTSRLNLKKTDSGDEDLVRTVTVYRCSSSKLLPETKVSDSHAWMNGIKIYTNGETFIERTDDLDGVSHQQKIIIKIPKHTQIFKIMKNDKLIGITTDDCKKTFIKICNDNGYNFKLNAIMLGGCLMSNFLA